MRIVLIGHNHPTAAVPSVVGGAETAQKLFVEVLAAAGHEVSVVRAGRHDEQVAPDRQGDVEIHTIPVPDRLEAKNLGRASIPERVLWHLRDDFRSATINPLEALLKAMRPDIVMSGNIGGLSSSVWSAARRVGAAPVHYIHDYYLLCHRSIRYRRGVCLRACAACATFTMRRRAATKALAGVVSNSSFMLKVHSSAGLFDDIPAAVIPPYVHHPPAGMAPRTGLAGVVFGYLGRISPEKGVERLVDAYGRAGFARELVIGGAADPQTRARLSAMARGKPVTFLGFTTPQALLERVDVLVAPSLLEEPFGIVVLEAMSHGRTVIVADHGGLPETMGGADFGWAFNPQDPHALSLLIDQVSQQPDAVRRKGLTAKDHAQLYTAARLVRGFEAIFERARERRPMG